MAVLDDDEVVRRCGCRLGGRDRAGWFLLVSPQKTSAEEITAQAQNAGPAQRHHHRARSPRSRRSSGPPGAAEPGRGDPHADPQRAERAEPAAHAVREREEVRAQPGLHAVPGAAADHLRHGRRGGAGGGNRSAHPGQVNASCRSRSRWRARSRTCGFPELAGDHAARHARDRRRHHPRLRRRRQRASGITGTITARVFMANPGTAASRPAAPPRSRRPAPRPATPADARTDV